MTQLHKLSPVATAMGLIQQLPMLRGFWPLSGQSWDGTTLRYSDYSGNGYHLLAASLSTSQSELYTDIESYVPYVAMSGGAAGYLYYPDVSQFDITGTETFVPTGQRGLTFGLWRHTDVVPSATIGLMSKYNSGAPQRSYLLYINSSNYAFAFMSGDGTATKYIQAGNSSIVANRWNFTVFRFVPSTALQVFSDGVWYENTTTIPAQIYNSTSRVELGTFNNGIYQLDGGVALAFVCGARVHKQMIENIWEVSREAFGR